MLPIFISSFFFNDTATTEIYTLSLHDALPIFRATRDEDAQAGSSSCAGLEAAIERARERLVEPRKALEALECRSEEHTSELQSRRDLVCRLLLEKKKK